MEYTSNFKVVQTSLNEATMLKIDNREDWILKNTGEGMVTYYDHQTTKERNIKAIMIILFMSLTTFLLFKYGDKKID